MEVAIVYRAAGVPAREHRLDRAPELSDWLLWHVRTYRIDDDPLEALDCDAHVARAQTGYAFDARMTPQIFQRLFEQRPRRRHHYVRIHLDEAPV